MTLTRPAHRVARLAVLLDLRDVPPDRFPAPDLAGVLLRHSAAHVVAAIPLEPAAWIIGMNPAFITPHGERLAGVNAEVVREQSRPEGESRACANQLAGNSLRQAVILFPQKTPAPNISFGLNLGQTSGSKI